MRRLGRTLAWSSLFFLVFLAACIPTGEAPLLLRPGDADTVSGSELKFVWSTVDEAAYYWLEVSSDSFFTSPSVFEDHLTDTFYTVDLGIDSPLAGEKTYYWQARAWVDAWGPWSETWSFFLAKAGPPHPPVTHP